MMRSDHGVNDPGRRQIAFESRTRNPEHPDASLPKTRRSAVSVEARCVRLAAKADDPASLAPTVERRSLSRAANELLIEVKAAAVNPSDVKAATGLMAYAVFPRTPGRDYAGIVIDGPAGWIGREVFGSSGDLGIRRDGTHATHLAVEADAVVEKPKNLSWEEAAGIGVPFVTAMEGFRRAGMPKQARDRAGDGRQRQGRPGRGADRELARRARDRRGAQERALRGPRQFQGRSHRRLGDGRRARVFANSPTARAPTSSSTRSAIPIFRRRTSRWRCAGGRS